MNDATAGRLATDKRKPLGTTPTAALSSCGECRFWSPLTADQQRLKGLERRGPLGECREGPPQVRIEIGPVMAYGLTDQSCPACGRGQKK